MRISYSVVKYRVRAHGIVKGYTGGVCQIFPQLFHPLYSTAIVTLSALAHFVSNHLLLTTVTFHSMTYVQKHSHPAARSFLYTAGIRLSCFARSHTGLSLRRAKLFHSSNFLAQRTEINFLSWEVRLAGTCLRPWQKRVCSLPEMCIEGLSFPNIVERKSPEQQQSLAAERLPPDVMQKSKISPSTVHCGAVLTYARNSVSGGRSVKNVRTANERFVTVEMDGTSYDIVMLETVEPTIAGSEVLESYG